MKNLGQKLFEPLPGETPEAHKVRTDRTRALFRDVFGTQSGVELLKALALASPPFEPRFSGDFNPMQAAFTDGEKSVVALLVANSQ